MKKVRTQAIQELSQWLKGVDARTAKVEDAPSTPKVVLGEAGCQLLIDAAAGRIRKPT